MKLFPLLRLVRFPNVFTAIADVTMGFLFVRGNLSPWHCFGLVAAASSCLYMAGMVLNDVFDLDQDRRERPHRPLPSGEMSVKQATCLGVGLLVVGVLLAMFMGQMCGAKSAGYRTWVTAVVLAVAIVAYDGFLKRTPLGPISMGLCRALNILLGMSVASLYPGPYFGFDASQLAVAIGMGTFVAGITWFARFEATVEQRLNLVGGIVVMLIGLSILASFPQLPAFADGQRALAFRWSGVWPLTVFVLGLSTIRRCVLAAAVATPTSVQTAVKQCILSLIVFDAAISMAVCSSIWWSLAVLSLIVPFLWFGRRIHST